MTQLEKILKQKPPQDQILKEVQMMKFKIRPVFGDISLLNFKDLQLIEALWGLGKIDDFFKKEMSKVSVREKETFFQLLNQMRGKLESQINKINYRKPVATSQVIEVEIFKEYPRKKN